MARKPTKFMLSDIRPVAPKPAMNPKDAMGNPLKGRVRTVTPHNGMVSVQRTLGRLKKNG